MVHAVFESYGCENRFGFAQLLLGRQMGLAQFDSHSDVLHGREGFKKIVGLEDESNLSPKLLHGSGTGSDEGLA
jgi:hypothetical protein